MVLDDLYEIKIVNVNDRGVPNKECIAIQINQPLNIGQYGVMIGHQPLGHNQAIPLRDNLYWFGDAILNVGDWIFLYTGPGNFHEDALPNGNKLYSVYWNRANTIFAASETVPILFKVGAVQLGSQPKNLPHTSN